MNFKPTPLKLILVILVGLIPGYYTFFITSIVEGTRPPDWFYNSLLQGLVVFLVVPRNGTQPFFIDNNSQKKIVN